jgi:SAM-dependent methyltransferase
VNGSQDMHRQAIERVFPRLETLLAGSDGLQWLELLHRLKSGGSSLSTESAMVDELISLGLCRRSLAGVTLTAFGSKCADSAREYLFWIVRDRKLYSEGTPPFVLENFRGKSVLEVGPGCGCNLMTLSTVTQPVGVEIEPIYVRFAHLFAKREGVRAPEIRLGTAERIPFESEQFDWVMLASVMAYVDQRSAFHEIARVLRPQGLALVTQSVLLQFLRYRLRDTVQSRNPRSLLSTASIAANTLWYQFFGRRLRENIAGDSTARPIHPTKAFLLAAGSKAGLRLRSDLSSRIGDEFRLVFQKVS